MSEGGTALVLGRLLADISRNLPNRPVDVEANEAKVQVACGSSRFTLREMPVSEYPSLPKSPENSGSIAGDVFTQAVAQVAIAADRGDTLPILTGVRVEIQGDKVTLLATDRYRLAMRELNWTPADPSAEYVALIPTIEGPQADVPAPDPGRPPAFRRPRAASLPRPSGRAERANG